MLVIIIIIIIIIIILPVLSVLLMTVANFNKSFKQWPTPIGLQS